MKNQPSDQTIKYRACPYYPFIEKVEIEKETGHCVWIKGRRINKTSELYSFFNTWDDAKSNLLERAERKVRSARIRLEGENGYLGTIKGLKDDT